MRRLVRAMLAGLGLCIAVAFGAVPTLGQIQPLDLEKSESDATVAGAATKVGLANNTDQPQTVSLAVRVPGAKLADGTQAEPASVLLVAPRVPLGPRQRADVELVPNPAVPLAPGSYRGVVEATSDLAGARDERGVVVTVAAAGAKASALPGLDKWTAVSYRFEMPGEEDRGGTLPLKKPAPGVTVSNPLGYLSNGSGRSLAVSGTVSADGKNVTLDFGDDARPGTYEGTIDFTPEDKDTGTLALTVRRTDSVALAAGAIALGLLGSYLGQRSFGVKRQLAKLDKQARAEMEKIKAGDRSFSESPELAGFTLVASAQKTLEELRSAVTKLRRRFVLSIDTASAEYKAADALRLSLEEAAKLWNADRVKAWRKLKDDLGHLRLGAPPPGALKERPQWLLNAERLLAGGALELPRAENR